MNEKEKLLLTKFANMIIKSGVNLQKGQVLNIKSPIECYEFARIIAKAGFENGAKDVHIAWNDALTNREYYLHADDETIEEVPDYKVEEAKWLIDNKACMVSIASNIPNVLQGVDTNKLRKAQVAFNSKLSFLRKYTMSNQGQWCVVSYPNEAWAKQVFPNSDDAFEKLLDAILKASHVREDNDPIVEWNNHMANLAKHNQILNDYNFKTLKFKNSLGTDLSVDLVEGHIWAGGSEDTQGGINFSPNIPTEETFTMPHSHGVNGRVCSTKPLDYQGNLIENFYLDFKDGKVVSYHAEKNEEALASLLKTDENSCRLGEVALISFDSPISNTNILFYNTLFDENASCHLALGNAYTMNIKDGYTLSDEELIKKGYNKSIVHVDFMFGSKDMHVVGITHDGKEVLVFENGNFVF